MGRHICHKLHLVCFVLFSVTPGCAETCDLFNLEADVPLRVVEIDGQTRPVQAGEQFDLRTNVTFARPQK